MPNYPHIVDVYPSPNGTLLGESRCLVVAASTGAQEIVPDGFGYVQLVTPDNAQQWIILMPTTAIPLFQGGGGTRYIYPKLGYFNPFYINFVQPGIVVNFIDNGPRVREYNVYSTHIRLKVGLDDTPLFY